MRLVESSQVELINIWAGIPMETSTRYLIIMMAMTAKLLLVGLFLQDGCSYSHHPDIAESSWFVQEHTVKAGVRFEPGTAQHSPTFFRPLGFSSTLIDGFWVLLRLDVHSQQDSEKATKGGIEAENTNEVPSLASWKLQLQTKYCHSRAGDWPSEWSKASSLC